MVRKNSKRSAPKGPNTIGRLLQKDRNLKKAAFQSQRGAGYLETEGNTETHARMAMQDAQRDTGQIGGLRSNLNYNLQSVTETNDLTGFLEFAALADRDFTAERRQVNVIESTSTVANTFSLNESSVEARAQNVSLLRVPRRPAWTRDMSKEEVEANEQASFIEWRRDLAELDSNRDLIMTPYEKNINVWRQLWRVVERSNVVVQIVDARNPLLFFCDDLDDYVAESGEGLKRRILLVNKADLLPLTLRRAWADYFDERGIEYWFWSAMQAQMDVDAEMAAEREAERAAEEAALAAQKLADITAGGTVNSEEASDGGDDDDGGDDGDDGDDAESGGVASEAANGAEATTASAPAATATSPEDGAAFAATTTSTAGSSGGNDDDARTVVISRDEMLQRFDNLVEEFERSNPDALYEGKLTVGMVGYPNVGKSSTINALFGDKKVMVSATPGKTKHFQTLILAPKVTLCDCPGLVFPSFASTRADMVCNGILPIDQMREHVGPVTLLCRRIPREILEALYGIRLPDPGEGEDPDRPPTVEELLNAYGYIRGFMTARGTPDQSRAARLILKDYVNGKLVYCEPPPGVEPLGRSDVLDIYLSAARDAGRALLADSAIAKLGNRVQKNRSDKAAMVAANGGVEEAGPSLTVLDEEFFLAQAAVQVRSKTVDVFAPKNRRAAMAREKAMRREAVERRKAAIANGADPSTLDDDFPIEPRAGSGLHIAGGGGRRKRGKKGKGKARGGRNAPTYLG